MNNATSRQETLRACRHDVESALAVYNDSLRAEKEFPDVASQARMKLLMAYYTLLGVHKDFGSENDLLESVEIVSRAMPLVQQSRGFPVYWLLRSAFCYFGAQARTYLGTVGYLEQAVRDCTEAIQEMDEHWSGVSTVSIEFVTNFADVYFARGDAQMRIGHHSTLLGAVTDFERSIAFLEQIPQLDRDLLQSLLGAYGKLIEAHLEIGTSQHLDKAAFVCDLISGSVLSARAGPWEAVDPRSVHNIAWACCMITKISKIRSTPTELKKALRILRRAENMTKRISPQNIIRAETLSYVLLQTGQVYSRFGTEAGNKHAIRKFTKAVEQARLLPLDSTYFTNLRACCVFNLGEALMQSKRLEDVMRASDFLDEAEALTNDFKWQHIELAEAYCASKALFAEWCLKMAMSHQTNPQNRTKLYQCAAVVASQGLEIAYSWEERGFHEFRSMICSFIKHGGHALIQFEPQFVAAFVLNSVDRNHNSRAIPQYSPLYAEALQVLSEARSVIVEKRLQSDFNFWQPHLSDLDVAIQRVDELRRKYFGGTLTGMRLLTTFYEQTGDLASAEEEFRRFVRAQPYNFGGVVALGEFYTRHGKPFHARHLYRRAATVLRDTLPDSATTEDLERAAEMVGHCIRKAAVVLIFKRLPHDLDAIDIPALMSIFDDALRWLERVRSVFPHGVPWVAVFDQVKSEWVQWRDQWFARERQQFAFKSAEQFELKWKQQLAQSEHDLRILASVAVFNDRASRSAFIHRFKELRLIYQSRLDQTVSNPKAYEDLLDAVAQEMVRFLQGFAPGFRLNDLRSAEKELARMVGPYEAILSAETKKHLIWGIHFLTAPDQNQMAAAFFGLALENELHHRCFRALLGNKDLKARLQVFVSDQMRSGISDVSMEGILFGLCRKNWTTLKLTQMIAVLEKTLLTSVPPTSEPLKLLTQELNRSFRNVSDLQHHCTDVINGLHHIRRIRNRSVHMADTITTVELHAAYQKLLGRNGVLSALWKACDA